MYKKIFSSTKQEEIQIWKQSKYKSTYLPHGDRRVYSTQWRDTWRKWERRHGAMDENGSALTLVRPFDNDSKRQGWTYLDQSQIELEHNYIYDRELYSPVDTKYMRSHYINGICLKDLAMMEGPRFIRAIEAPYRRSYSNGYGGKKRKS